MDCVTFATDHKSKPRPKTIYQSARNAEECRGLEVLEGVPSVCVRFIDHPAFPRGEIMNVISQEIERLLKLSLRSNEDFDKVLRLVQNNGNPEIAVILIRLCWIIKDCRLNDPQSVEYIIRTHMERSYGVSN